MALFEAKYSSSVDLLSTPLERLKVTRGWILLQPFFCPLILITFRRPCTIDFYDDNNSSAAKDDSNTAGGAQSLQRMDSAPAFFFAPSFFYQFRRPCTIDFYDDNYSSAAKDDSNTAGVAQSLQRMDSAPGGQIEGQLRKKILLLIMPKMGGGEMTPLAPLFPPTLRSWLIPMWPKAQGPGPPEHMGT